MLTDSARQMDSGLLDSHLCPQHGAYSSRAPYQVSYVGTRNVNQGPHVCATRCLLPDPSTPYMPWNLEKAKSKVTSQNCHVRVYSLKMSYGDKFACLNLRAHN